ASKFLVKLGTIEVVVTRILCCSTTFFGMIVPELKLFPRLNKAPGFKSSSASLGILTATCVTTASRLLPKSELKLQKASTPPETSAALAVLVVGGRLTATPKEAANFSLDSGL